MVERKRVLYISYDDIQEPLSQSQVLPYIKGLSQKYDMFLLTFDKRKMSKEQLRDTTEKYKLKDIFSLTYHKKPVLIATCFDILCGVIKTLVITKRYNISFIHARSYVACAIALALKKITGLPYIFDVRGFLADERVDSGDWRKSSIVYKTVKFYEKIMLREAKCIILLSHEGARLVEDIMGKYGSRVEESKIAVIPTCVDTNFFSPNKNIDAHREDEWRFVYIGSLGTWYMLSEMLDFFNVTRKFMKNAKFLILTQSNISITREFIEDKNIDRNAIEVKRESHEGIPRQLETSDASIFFIRPTFSKKASCPTKFAESLSMGIPVIANSGIGDLDYFIKKYSVGVLIDGFRKEDYEKAAIEIRDLLKERHALKERCRRLSMKEFSLESGVKKYEDIYKSVI